MHDTHWRVVRILARGAFSRVVRILTRGAHSRVWCAFSRVVHSRAWYALARGAYSPSWYAFSCVVRICTWCALQPHLRIAQLGIPQQLISVRFGKCAIFPIGSVLTCKNTDSTSVGSDCSSVPITSVRTAMKDRTDVKKLGSD